MVWVTYRLTASFGAEVKSDASGVDAETFAEMLQEGGWYWMEIVWNCVSISSLYNGFSFFKVPAKVQVPTFHTGVGCKPSAYIVIPDSADILV